MARLVAYHIQLARYGAPFFENGAYFLADRWFNWHNRFLCSTIREEYIVKAIDYEVILLPCSGYCTFFDCYEIFREDTLV